jgi:hypothetical protein
MHQRKAKKGNAETRAQKPGASPQMHRYIKNSVLQSASPLLIHIDYFTSFLCKSKAVMPRRNARNSEKDHGPYPACKKCKKHVRFRP